jgi:hypothetical protein
LVVIAEYIIDYVLVFIVAWGIPIRRSLVFVALADELVTKKIHVCFIKVHCNVGMLILLVA